MGALQAMIATGYFVFLVANNSADLMTLLSREILPKNKKNRDSSTGTHGMAKLMSHGTIQSVGSFLERVL